MTGFEPNTGPEEVPGRKLGSLVEDELFTSSFVTSRQKESTRSQRLWRGIGLAGRASIILHTVVVALIIFVPIFTPAELPHRDVITVLFYDPPPPPPPPLPKGSKLREEPLEPQAPKLVVEDPPEETDFVAPIETPTPTEVAELKPEEAISEDDQFGSEFGSDFGVVEGMEDGVEGGMVGGIPGGVLGGVLGGTGSGPVMDYDSPPKIIKLTKPQYPQEAFVKKVEGVVTVEILIDSTGRVVRARILQSVPMLDAAALQTVYQWVFSPAMKHGRPVPTIAHAPVRFAIY